MEELIEKYYSIFDVKMMHCSTNNPFLPFIDHITDNIHIISAKVMGVSNSALNNFGHTYDQLG